MKQGGLAPLFRAMVERVEATILKLHDADCYGQQATTATKEDEIGSSKYMDELEKILIHYQVRLRSGADDVYEKATDRARQDILLLIHPLRYCFTIRTSFCRGYHRLARATIPVCHSNYA